MNNKFSKQFLFFFFIYEFNSINQLNNLKNNLISMFPKRYK